MTTRTSLLEWIISGESSSLEFKRDTLTNYDLAKELVSLLNFMGGRVLLGVEDDGTISGVSRDRLEEWVADLCRTKIEPPVIPHLSWVRDVEPGKDVLCVQVPVGPDKPYARVHDSKRTYFVRVGSTCREASRDELERLFQTSGKIRYGLKPVPGATLDDLDVRRLRDYFSLVIQDDWSDDVEVSDKVRTLLIQELAVDVEGTIFPTVDGILLFGRNPKRFVGQGGIRALAFPGTDMDYARIADQDLKAPMLPVVDRASADGWRRVRGEPPQVSETGLVEQALDFVNRNTQPKALLQDGRRIDHPAIPPEVLREVIVNALIHRDYSIAGTDITLAVFSDRVEVRSPGRLPNTVSVEAMKAGFRYARNQTLVNVMRDYGYAEFSGMGVRRKVIPGMKAHNATEPEFIETERDFTVVLRLTGTGELAKSEPKQPEHETG